MARSQQNAHNFARFCGQVGLPLEPFQRKAAGAIFGPEREVALLMPKGNAKSSLAALLAIHHLLVVSRPTVVLGAGSREQARVVFELAREIAAHPSLEGLIVPRHLELRVRGGTLRVVASDGGLAHGPTPSLSIIDELWAHKSGELYQAQRTALVKRPDARLLVLSTAPRTAETPLGRLRTRALAGNVERRGVFTDARAPGLRLLEWGLTADDDLDDDRLVAACNPASWISADVLAEQRLALPRPVFLQFHANLVGAGEGQWLPPGAWSACADDDYVVDGGERVTIGIDIGGSRATTAVVAVTADLRIASVEVFEGDDAVLRVPDAVRALASRYDVGEIAYDPWRFQGEALRLEAEGLLMVEFPQSHARMTVASELLHSAIVERRLRHRGHRLLDMHVASAAAKQTGRGWRLVKATNAGEIDSVIALCMAVDRASQQQSKPVELLGWL